CCEDCINDLGDGINGVDHKEAEVCINADNSISNDSEAIYHAGYEVVLLPDFVASSGSSDRFYIEGCSGEFAARGMSQQEESLINNSMNNVYVYPNPANDRLNIDFGDLILTNIEIYTLDG